MVNINSQEAMKKFYSAVMLIAAAAIAFSSCNKVEPQGQDINDVNVEKSSVFHITASTIDTKSVFGDKVDGAYPTIWTTNKSVAFSRDEAALVEGVPTLVNDGASATFYVDLEGEETEGTIYAFSPKGVYDENNASNNVPGFTSINSTFHDVYLNIPSEQTPLANSVDEAAQALFGSAAYSDGECNLDMSFSHVVAYGKMAITNFAGGDISSVEITFPENVVGGSCYFYYTGEKEGTISNMNGKTITLNPDNIVDNVFWFALAPTAGATGSMKIVVKDENEDTYTKTIDLTKKPLPFVKGQVSSFTANFSEIEADLMPDAVFTISKIADTNNWANSVAYNITADDNGNTGITISYVGGGNNGKYYESDESWRLYTSGGMTVTAAAGNIITKIEIIKSVGALNSSDYDDNSGIWSGSANSISFNATATTRIQKINVWYESAPTVDVTGVDLNKTMLSLVEGQNETLTATVNPSNATNKTVTWKSSDTSVATVDGNGKVTAVKAGTATITVTTDDGGKTATCTVTVTEKTGGDSKILTFDLSSNPGGWPTTNSTTLTDYTYTLDATDYTFGLKNVKCNSGYLMLTQPAALGLPAIVGYKLTKVVAKNSGGCSTSVNVGVSSSSSSASYITGGDAQNWAEQGSTYTYNLTGTDPNTVYYLYVTSKNAQIVELTLTYEQ